MMWDLSKFKKNTALQDEHGSKLTYADLQASSDDLYEKIGHRCLVFSLCLNEIGSVLGYVSFINHGVVPVMLSAHIEKDLLQNLLDIYRPEYLWVTEGMKDDFTGGADDSSDTTDVMDGARATDRALSIGAISGKQTDVSAGMQLIYATHNYALIKTNYEITYPLYDELGLLLTTSGSTGSPKFVRQSYENILSNTQAIVEYLGLNESERPITTLPMNYTYGLSIINTHLYVGATILLTEKTLMQKEFWTFFKESEATSFGGVPYTYEMLDKLRFYRMDLPNLRTMTQAGGKITPELHEKFAAFAAENQKHFVVMYGQCEATARMGYLPADKAVEKKGSMGIPIPGGSFRLIADDGQEVSEPYTTGELIYTGKNVTLGYAECGDDLIKGDDRHGILETGDMAQFDEDGYYYIVGRKKRFLKIYGNRVNLDEMDRLIKGKYDIEVACAGVDDHMYVFVAGADDELELDEIKDFASAKTGLNPVAFKVVLIDEIPKNDSGKVLYKELESYY